MHLPSPSAVTAADEVCAGELTELGVNRRLGLAGKGCGCTSRNVGAGVEGQHAEDVLLLWDETVEGLIEDGTQIAFTVIDAIQPPFTRSEAFSAFSEGLARILHEKCSNDLQGERKASAGDRHPLGSFPFLFDTLIVGICFAQSEI
ncbi:hypothetical protein ACFXDO_21270 [Streptomyces nigra]|uniref:hypothetical protein n=1 Tax=Streptomyces nigra TaxID=1827580 RepID=UPI00368516A1